MELNNQLLGMPSSFKDEKKELIEIGITSWDLLKSLNEEQINQLVKTGRSTPRNLRKIQGLAALICDLRMQPSHAALLLHSGFATVSSLANATPEEVLKKTGRLERQLLSRHQTLINLKTANEWIKRARDLQLQNGHHPNSL